MDASSGSELVDMNRLEKLLNSWAHKITESTTEIVHNAFGRSQDGFSNSGIAGVLDDTRDRQSRIITTIQEAHSRQLEMLKAAIAEERKEFARAQLVFEQTLKTKYDHVVDALQETIKAEQQARLLRTVKSLESYAQLESERAKQAFQIEHETELLLAQRLKSIMADLRRSWEAEETGRIKQIEEKLRSGYQVVIDHMEAQLRMALQWQDDIDKKWLEELDLRNRKQFESIKLFEENCRKLYETRLTEYAEKTNAQIAQYEDKLLEIGSSLASERAQFESRLRRMKLASSRWKLAYQRELHERYRALNDALEERYIGEVNGLLDEVKVLKDSLQEAHRTIESKEKELLKSHQMFGSSRDNGVNLSSLPSMASLRQELVSRWDALKLSPQERIDALASLLDATLATPAVLSLYEAMSTKLNDRVPIHQLVNRRQFLEYKLKLASRTGSIASVDGAGTSGMSVPEKAELIGELTEVKNNLERLVKQYEKTYGETLALSGVGLSNTTPAFSSFHGSVSATALQDGPTTSSAFSPPQTGRIASALATARDGKH